MKNLMMMILVCLSTTLLAQTTVNPSIGIDMDIAMFPNGDVDPFVRGQISSKKQKNAPGDFGQQRTRHTTTCLFFTAISLQRVKAGTGVFLHENYLYTEVYATIQYKEPRLSAGLGLFATLPEFQKLRPLVGFMLDTRGLFTTSVQIRYRFGKK